MEAVDGEKGSAVRPLRKGAAGRGSTRSMTGSCHPSERRHGNDQWALDPDGWVGPSEVGRRARLTAQSREQLCRFACLVCEAQIYTQH